MVIVREIGCSLRCLPPNVQHIGTPSIHMDPNPLIAPSLPCLVPRDTLRSCDACGVEPTLEPNKNAKKEHHVLSRATQSVSSHL